MSIRPHPSPLMSPKARIFWPLVSLLVLADCATKALVVEHLSPAHVPHDVIEVGVGMHRVWTFNVADAGITIGALLLAAVLWRSEQTRTG